jgi:branched-chain amino acid transport system ATP-binding protein
MLEISNINTSYGDSQVLWDVSLTVEEGEVVGLLGRNGAGKTTTLRSITGIQPPDSGDIHFKGENITDESVTDISRRGIKLVLEERRPFTGLTVEENLQISVDTRHGDEWTVDRALEEFPRLEERLDQRAGHLSGGEQQMLVIAQALVGNPEIILLDEPMEGLAPQIVDQIVDIVDRIKAANIPVLLVEQNFEICMELMDRGYLLHKGEIKFSGETADFAEATDEIDQYLGVKTK